MYFSSTVVTAFLACLVWANTIEFVNQDSTTRTIYFTPARGLADVGPLVISGLTNSTVPFLYGWNGNFFSVSEGADILPGMLGEVCWDTGQTWFDVSAILNPKDMNGVKTIAPKISGTPLSGCESYEDGCGSAYYSSNENQTKSTAEKDLVCTLGTKTPNPIFNVREHHRHFVFLHGSSKKRRH